MVFRRYLALGSVLALHAELEHAGVTSRPRVTRSGRHFGGKPLSRGALYLLLQNRIYLGEIAQEGAAHAGEHQAIITRELFDEVQDQLERNRPLASTRASPACCRASCSTSMAADVAQPCGEAGKALLLLCVPH